MRKFQTLGTRCRLSAVGLLGIALSVGSQAQQAQTTDNPQALSSALQEVVVTAERRESTLQKSSLALQVLTSDALSQAGVTDAPSREWLTVTPT